MRNSWKALWAIWAIVLATAASAGADTITAGDAAGLADKINRGAATSLDIQPGTYAVTEPLYVKRGLTLGGKNTDGTAARADKVVITEAPVTGGCFGNAVKNPDFELGDTAWTPTGIVTDTPADAQGGSKYYALFNGPQVTGTTVPEGSTDFTNGAALDLTKYTGTFPASIKEQLVWQTDIPYKLSPFPVNLTNVQSVNVAPGTYTQSVELGAVTSAMGSSVMFWLRILKYNAGDTLAIKDSVTGAAASLNTV